MKCQCGGEMHYETHNEYGYIFICSECVGVVAENGQRMELKPEESKSIYKRIDNKVVDILCPFCKTKMRLLKLFFHPRNKDIPNGDMLYQCSQCSRYAIARKKDMFWSKVIEKKTPIETSIEKKRNLCHYVYFIEAGNTGCVKIGVARIVEERLNGLQLATFHPLKIREKISCASRKEALQKESELHKLYANKSIGREWFKLFEEKKKTILSL